MSPVPDSNPDALRAAAPPHVDVVSAAGTSLYTEVRGSGSPVLLIGAADEDAEFYRGVAERLADHATVITYDRRGTRRSGRDDWPGGGSEQHADDAAALIEALGAEQVTVLGCSAGAIVTLRMALRHPEVVSTALCFEPGLFAMVPGGREFRAAAESAVNDHLAAHPGDWSGAAEALGRAAVASTESGTGGLFSPPPDKKWYGERGDENAESLIRGDLALIGEAVALDEIASSPADIRFSYGTASLPIFRDVTTLLAAATQHPATALEDVGHGVYFHPDAAVDLIRRCMA